ncbi:MAG: phosphodiester glycosidase family protein [bacterium]
MGNYIFFFIIPTCFIIPNFHTVCLIGGLPKIVYDGKAIENYVGLEGLTSTKFIGKNPRTAIGYNKTKDKIYIVAIDGRDAEHSVGITLPKLALYLVSIGCYSAVNFDGGGSTTMVLRDSVVNCPTDFTGERKVHNALFVCSTDTLKDIISSLDISFDDDEISLSDKIEISISAYDKWGFKLNVLPNNIKWTFDGINGKIVDNLFYPESVGSGTIKWQLGKINGEFKIIIEE